MMNCHCLGMNVSNILPATILYLDLKTFLVFQYGIHAITNTQRIYLSKVANKDTGSTYVRVHIDKSTHKDT